MHDFVAEIVEPKEALTGQRIPSYIAEDCRIYRVPEKKPYGNSEVAFVLFASLYATLYSL